MYRKVNSPSLTRRAGTSFCLGFFVFVLGALLENALDRFNVSGMSALFDDLLIGLLAGGVVFAYEWHQHKTMLKEMRVIADMNHHIRNALQPILYSPYVTEQAEQMRIIKESTERIQWALSEVLPGDSAASAPGRGPGIAA
jgi:hypothetical protein